MNSRYCYKYDFLSARRRLDFVSFILEQPNQQTVCNTDTFTVTGASETVPVICGTNSGQHSK